MTTVSVFRGCAGAYIGAGHVHPALLDAARETVARAKEQGLVSDTYVARCGDEIGLVLLHDESVGSGSVKALAEDVFRGARDVAARLHQHESNGDALDVDSAEISFVPRESEPILCFFSDRADPGSWNLHLYRAFADPFNTPSLITGSSAHQGARFAVRSAGVVTNFDVPCDLYRLLRSVAVEHSSVTQVRATATGEVAAVASFGKEPVLVVRAGEPFPAVEEVLEAFTTPYAFGTALAGPSPLVPVSANGDSSTRSVGRAVGLGFQVAGSRLIGPRDLLGDAAFDEARRQAATAADYFRRHGPFAFQRNGHVSRV